MARKIPTQWIDLKTGQITREAYLYLNDLEKGATNSINSVGTILAGVNQVQQAILDGTQPLTDVYVTGLGPITGVVDAQNTNIATVTGVAGGGALVATTNKSSVAGTRVGAGTVTTATVTVTASGGTGPYTYAWTNVSGDTFTVTAPAGASTAFQITVAVGEQKSAVYRCTVTDSLAATYTVDVGVGAAEIS